jgi:hypothetical protein
MRLPREGLQAAKAGQPIMRSNVARLTCGRRQKGLAIGADWSGSCRHSGRQRALSRSCPAGESAEVGLRWCGATPRNRTEDLDVKVFEEATGGVSASGRSNRKIIAAHCGRCCAEQGSCRLEAIAHHRDVAITHGRNDRSDEEGHGLAVAFGARLSCRRGAQAPQAEARLEEGGRQSGLPDRERR